MTITAPVICFAKGGICQNRCATKCARNADATNSAKSTANNARAQFGEYVTAKGIRFALV
jgi:hypothetical protein